MTTRKQVNEIKTSTSSDSKLSGYKLSSKWFDFCFENPEKIKPLHSAVYFFMIEHCNRLGMKEKFGLPTAMAMEAIGIKKWHSYKQAIDDLIEWGFIILIQKSKNQYSSTIISIISDNAYDKKNKALDKALSKHGAKHGQSTRQSTGDIVKQENNTTINQDKNTENKKYRMDEFSQPIQEALRDWLEYKNCNYKEVGWKSFKTILTNGIGQHGDEAIIYRINEAIAGNWQGLNINKIDNTTSNKKCASYENDPEFQRDLAMARGEI